MQTKRNKRRQAMYGFLVAAMLIACWMPGAKISHAAGTVSRIAVSQAGYSAADYKIAYVIADEALTDMTYQVLDGSTVVAGGMMKDEGEVWNSRVYSVDFTSVTQTGTNFTVRSNGVSSYPFPIETDVWTDYKDEMTAFYRMQRSGIATSDAYPAGYSSAAPSAKAFHPAGHLDDAKSQDSTQHYDLTGGWYDAGDYGKYAGNQWVTGEIALAYLRHSSAPDVRFDNDANGVPDLIDEARFGSEYVLKFADQLGGAIYNLSNNAGFVHPEKSTDNITGTADDRKLNTLGVGGSGKAAGALAATARAIDDAIANGCISSAQTADFQAFSSSIAAAAVTFYDYAIANQTGPGGSYATNGGIPNTLLWAETELYLLTGDPDYKTSAQSRVDALTFDDLYSTNYWDLRPLSLAELYPVADAATQTHIHALLKSQADSFMSLADDTPYGVVNRFGDFGVNEPQASYLGDMVRYYELFQDPAVLRSLQKGLYWIFGGNPWNISWVSGIGTDYVDFLHTRLDEQAYSHTNTGIVIPGALVSGPNIKDTKNKQSVSPWYEDRPLWQDDTQQWRYNEYSISIQAGLLYTIMGLIDLTGASSDGGVYPAGLPIASPVIGDYVTGAVNILAKPADPMSAVDYKGPGIAAYTPMSADPRVGGVYAGTVNTAGMAPYANVRVDVRGTDAAGGQSYSSTHFTVAPPLPDPSHPLPYDDFGGGGTWGSQAMDWVNWWNQDGGAGTYGKVSADGRTAGKFAQTPASNKSWAKFEPWKDTVDLSGYRYLTVTMKNPGYANSRIRINIEDSHGDHNVSGGWVNVPTAWTTYNFDLNAIPSIDKTSAHIVVWLSQTTGQYGEMLVDGIEATNQASGAAPTLASAVSATEGSPDTDFTFAATYTDADNQQPYAVNVVIDGIIRRMTETDASDTTYSDGKGYAYTAKLPEGSHTYYVQTSDTTSAAVNGPIGQITVAEHLYAPAADAYVRDGTYANQNFGAASPLDVKSDAAGYKRKAYLKFDYGDFAGPSVSSATLWLYATNVGSDPTRTVKLYATADDSWSESGLTWNNAPAAATLIGQTDMNNTPNRWYGFDVTSYVNSRMTDKLVSFVLVNEGAPGAQTIIGFNSKEAALGRPALILNP